MSLPQAWCSAMQLPDVPHFYSPRTRRLPMMRRLLDVLFGLFWWILTAPVMLIVAICIKLDSLGPILYIPKMVGHKGTVFPFFRFRTMYIDRFTDLDADQRVTRVGRFIRNYSLDHLPILINL